jgi:FtsZ-binding cell division protein ZapB
VQAETEELAVQVESLTAENTSLRSEIGKLTKSSEKLRMENSALAVWNIFMQAIFTMGQYSNLTFSNKTKHHISGET